ncbi:MAG: hypothetical protein H6838_11155 [Planctomycetes bacterium]|nr:hypothetical protein [Planctomycetota bacterium]
MLTDRANIMLDAWRAELVTDAEIRSWAESEMMAISDAGEMPTWLLDLVTHGPGSVVEQGHDWRRTAEFGVEFAFASARVDLADRGGVVRFARWLAGASLGEDLDLPEVVLGYQVDHYLDQGDVDLAVQCVREGLPGILSSRRDLLRKAVGLVWPTSGSS